MHTLQTQQIVEQEERLRQAMLHSDTAMLDELIAPELVFTNHFGQTVSKQDDLALHRSGVLRLRSLEPAQQRVQCHPGFAIVSVLMHLQGDFEGAPIDLHIRYTRIWAPGADGALRIVAGHASAPA
jgi:ketosteroid isomerase-like protein